MSDADLGSWSYAYNALGQLTRQTDARDKTSCLNYDSIGRMRGRLQRVASDNVSRSFIYDSYSRVSNVSVTIDSLTRATSFSFDDHHRPTAVTYHGGEVITALFPKASALRTVKAPGPHTGISRIARAPAGARPDSSFQGGLRLSVQGPACLRRADSVRCKRAAASPLARAVHGVKRS